MNIAVTGASGYIGRHLVRSALDAGHDIHALAYAHPPPALEHESATWLQGSIEQADVIEQLIRPAEVVVHLASFVHRQAISPADVALCHRINVNGMKVLLEVAQRQDSSPFIVFASTIAVYAPSGQIRDENAPCIPGTPYGRSKLEAERMLLEAIEAGRARGCILRPSIVYGPQAPGNMIRLFRLIDRGLVPMVAGGMNRKSILYIDNLIQSIWSCLEAPSETNGEIYNVSDMPPMAWRDLVSWIADAIQKKPLVCAVPGGVVESLLRLHDGSLGKIRSSAYLPTFHTFTQTSAITCQKLSDQTNYRPLVSHQEGIRRMAEWYLRTVVSS